MATELEELLGFLSSPSPPIKKAAVDIVRDYTGSEDGLLSIGNYSSVAFPSLSRLLAEKNEVLEPAAEALVNLSQNKLFTCDMVMDILYKQDCDIIHLLVMLLLNLTQLDLGIESLLQHGDEKMRGLYITKLVRSFCTSSTDQKSDPFEHVASILVNVSQKEEGRKLLLDPKRGLLKQIIRQFDSPSILRKKGVSGTIRNCCFEAENQLQNLLLISEFLWPSLLLPVAGNKVTSSHGNSYHHSEDVNEGHFAFQAVESGDYMACFYAADHKPSTTLTIDFDWKAGIASKDWTSVAKKGSVESMEVELKKMFDTVQSIHDEMFYLRQREEEMQKLNASTNSKMTWFSFLSLLISLSVAALQFRHLKSFFQKKKLI